MTNRLLFRIIRNEVSYTFSILCKLSFFLLRASSIENVTYGVSMTLLKWRELADVPIWGCASWWTGSKNSTHGRNIFSYFVGGKINTLFQPKETLLNV